tara:strand:- start:3488 stop:4276 length:789 start_codon:yes stop_codon:yes gene_type:complete
MVPTLRSALWLGFFSLILVAWLVMYAMSTGMGLDLLGRPDSFGQAMRAMDPAMEMSMPMARFGPLAAMWATMMAAMMLPTMVPTLRSYQDLMHSATGTQAGWLGVLLGYFAMWLLFALLIASVQMVLLHGGVIDMLGIARSRWVAAALLLAVGLFQFTRTKEICHGVCHSQMMYFLGNWQQGFTGGVRMGLTLGSYCVGCCWGMMALGFVGGVMNLAWMGLATLFMVLEKLPQIGHRIIKPMGFLLILAAVGVAGWPVISGG